MSRAPSSPRTDRAVAREVAASVDAPPALAPVFAALFDGLDALGGMPVATANLLARAGLPRRARVVDLACGKGATAVELARRHGCRVLGVDACPAFIDAAAALARRRGVASLCTFRVGDIRDAATLRPRAAQRADAALMLGLDPVERAAPLLRSLVRRGGLYAIDDCFLDLRHPHARRWADVPTRADHERSLRALGDEPAAALVPAPARVRRLNERLDAALRRNAAALRRARPDLAAPLRDFLANQRRANAVLGGPLRPALWVVRRN